MILTHYDWGRPNILNIRHLTFLQLFLAIFSGDFAIGPIFGFEIAFLASIAWSAFLFKEKIPRVFMFSVLAFIPIIFLYIGNLSLISDLPSGRWVTGAVTVSIYLVCLHRATSGSFVVPESLVYFLLLCFLILVAGNLGAGARVQIVFGPNMLYRILCLLYVLVLIWLSRDSTKLNIQMISASLIYFFSLVQIGSRGGLVVALFLMFAYMLARLNIRNFSVVTSVAIFLLVFNYLFGSRIFLVKQAELDGDASRVILLIDSVRFFLDAPLSVKMLGGGGDAVAQALTSYSYPHNFVIEALLSGGLVLVTFLMLFMTFSFLLIRFNFIVFSVVWVMVVGSLVSGSNFDNYMSWGGLIFGGSYYLIYKARLVAPGVLKSYNPQ